MIKLLILAKNIDGGTGSFISAFSYWKKKDIDIKIAVLEKPIFRKIKNIKINYFYPKNFYAEKYQLTLNILSILFKESLWLKKIVEINQINIILSIDSHCLILAQILRFIFLKKVKLIASIHNNIERVIKYKLPFFLSNLVKKIIGLSLKKTDRIIVVSKDLSNHIYYFFNLKNKPVVINCGLSLNCFHQRKNQIIKKNNENQYKNIVTVSRLSPQKDIKNIIKAFKIINKKMSKLRLYIVGDGPLKKTLKILVKRLKLKNIFFLGWKNNLSKIMKKSNLFLFSSNWEGFPYVLIEAMSYGLPIISTDTPFGPREILDKGKYGILVPMKNPKAMSDAIYELLTNKNKYKYYSKKSLERIKFFSLNKMIKAYKKIIFDLIKIKK